jgi:hypothetical protein
VYVRCWQNQFLLIAYSVWPTLVSMQIFMDPSFCECSASASKIEHSITGMSSALFSQYVLLFMPKDNKFDKD